MAARVKVVVTGLKAIDKKLAQLPYRVQGKVVRPAMRAGMKLMAAAVKAEVPVDTGLTRRNVKVRATPKRLIKKGDKSTTIAIEVVVEAVPGLKKTSGRTGKAVFYPAIVQYGGKHIRKNPFMSRAYDRRGDAARRRTIELLKDGVNREIKAL
jgi:HK97 gp10 family phage protein